MGDAADNAVKKATILIDDFLRKAGLRSNGTKAQRIENGNRICSHRENVSQNSADAGSRALKRFDVAGMIVRFHLERGGKAVAHVHDAGIFTGALQNLR